MDKLGDFPAFPISAQDGGSPFLLTPHRGMSLRVYLAAKALPWCLAEFGGNAEDMKQPVEAAFQIADLMLIESEKEARSNG